MATSVKMDESTKDRLERLQAEIKLETGRKIPQQELLKQLVDRGYESRSDIIDTYRDTWDGLTDEEVERFLSGTVDTGDPIDEDDIDEVLYGSEIE